MTEQNFSSHLAILRCPLTQAPLRELSQPELDRLEQRRAAGGLFHLDGTPVQLPLEAGLRTVSEGNAASPQFIYPVLDGILVLLPTLAIPLEPQATAEMRLELRPEKQLVLDYYDQAGWRPGEEGNYGDAERFEDMRPVAAEYVHRCRMRVKEHLPAKGTYLLDAASGPVQYPEYVTYSDAYQVRVCVDISLQALKEAQKKLGKKGLYLLADITRLPLQDGSMDAVVSLHTLYHVPKDEQPRALKELWRVLKSGGTGVVVYSWGPHARLTRWFAWSTWVLKHVRQGYGKVKRFLLNLARPGARPGVPGGEASSAAPPKRLPFHAYDYAFITSQDWGFPLEIRGWRSLGSPFTRLYIYPWLFGKHILRLVYRWEETNPHLAGRVGQYPMFIIRK